MIPQKKRKKLKLTQAKPNPFGSDIDIVGNLIELTWTFKCKTKEAYQRTKEMLSETEKWERITKERQAELDAEKEEEDGLRLE